MRFSYELDIPELRAIGTQQFRYLVFYLPDDDTIDIWRVLHSRRDLPRTLAVDG
jgi:toxin ParE1/3/4